MPLPTFPEIQAKSKELGFQHLGILNLPVLDWGEAEVGLKAWLRQGFHADMAWMVTHLDKRLKPELLMDGTKSVLCVTMNYNTGPQHPESEAKIARYARGEDYHRVVKKRLKVLLQWMQSQDPTLKGRALTDSAPILEKALAVKAGLGWQGKHSCLITKDIGSWVFLGELFLNQVVSDAPTPTPITNHCGTCRRCIEACPTDAIIRDGVIDANRCISYWTIEHKGDAFPEAITENLNGWLFGCDICQDVCPWNIKFEQPTQESAFEARAWTEKVHLEDLLALDEATFKTQYQHSPIKRPKLSGLKRNANELLKSTKRAAVSATRFVENRFN